jgi:hypothetical protein
MVEFSGDVPGGDLCPELISSRIMRRRGKSLFRFAVEGVV